MGLDNEEIKSRFGSHKATLEGPAATAPKHVSLRLDFQGFVRILNEKLEDGREKDLAMTALEEASMWSHKAIAKTAPIEDV